MDTGYFDRDRMAGRQAIEFHGLEQCISHEGLQVVQLGVGALGGECLDEGGEGLVEPKIIPPVHSD